VNDFSFPSSPFPEIPPAPFKRGSFTLFISNSNSKIPTSKKDYRNFEEEEIFRLSFAPFLPFIPFLFGRPLSLSQTADFPNSPIAHPFTFLPKSPNLKICLPFLPKKWEKLKRKGDEKKGRGKGGTDIVKKGIFGIIPSNF
jgi:hypothetical protein